jgi:hypothetical protein
MSEHLTTQMTDESTTPSFIATDPTLESDDYVVYLGKGTLAIYSNQPNSFSLPKSLNYEESTLLIYAETVTIESDNVQLASKNLGIFCNQLMLTHPNTVIDVSGKRGDASVETSEWQTSWLQSNSCRLHSVS